VRKADQARLEGTLERARRALPKLSDDQLYRLSALLEQARTSESIDLDLIEQLERASRPKS
jgi:hypothetical protein